MIEGENNPYRKIMVTSRMEMETKVSKAQALTV